MPYEIVIPQQFIEFEDNIRYIRLKTGDNDPEEKKQPKDSGWTRGDGGRKYNDPELISWISKGNNYGYHFISGNICIFDCDDPLYDPSLISIFSDTFAVKTGRGYHFIFKTNISDIVHGTGEKIVLDSHVGHIGHILLPGMKFQTVGPGCIHPNGGIYHIFKDLPIKYISPEIINNHIKSYVKIDENNESVFKYVIPGSISNISKTILTEILDLRVEDIGYPTGNIRQHGFELQGVHPFHGSSRGDKGDNYCINPTKGVWCCFRHGTGGDAAMLLAVKHGIIDCDDAKPGILNDPIIYNKLLDIIRHGAEGADMANKLIEYEMNQREEYIKLKSDEYSDVNISGILSCIPHKIDSGLPDYVLSIPGVLQQVVNYYNATAAKPQPQIAVHTAIAVGAVVLGRRFFSNEDNGSNMFLAIVAKSSAGKEHSKTVIERILYASENMALIGPPGYTSSGGLATALINQPNHIAMIDEFGRMLDSVKKAGNSNSMDAITGLIQVYGRQTGIYSPPGYSDIASIIKKKGKKEDTDITISLITKNPAITLLGITTPSTLFDSINSKDISNGFLPRFVVIDSVYGRQVSRRRNLQDTRIPDSIISWCHDNSRAGNSAGDLSCVCGPEFPPEPIILRFSDESYDLLEEYEEEYQKYQDANENTGLDVMWGRCRENAQRLALIAAVSCGSDIILPEHTAWAISYVKFYSERMIKLVGGNISDTNFEAAVKSVYAAIEKAGERGLTISEMSDRCRKFKGLDTRMRLSVIDAVVSDYGCGILPTPPQRGVKRKAYALNKYLKEE